MRGEEAPQDGALHRQRRQPETKRGSLPPRTLWITRRRELIPEQFRANVTRRFARERIAGQQVKRAGIVVQKLPNKVNGPRILFGRRHRRKPDLPVEPLVIGAEDARPAHWVARLALEFVLLPLAALADDRIRGAFQNDFVPLAA